MIIPSPVSKSNSTIQHTNETTIETLSVNDQEDYESNQFNGNRKIKLMNRPHEFHQTHESNETLRSKSPSISISISDESNSPSYFIGDEIKFNKLKDLSTSNLTSTSTSNLKHSNSLQSALSCVATIASESVISSNPPIKEDLNQKEDDSSDHHQLTHNLTSLIEHKTFLWEMMSRSDDLKTSSNQIKSLDSLDELNLDETHESVYWKSRKSSS
ncbi:hypothetical protein DFH28DRAFT_884594 [Melampsora americana]|nr:hypothetical protein DFH28DRAFT_884594 [Melampsora americana]